MPYDWNNGPVIRAVIITFDPASEKVLDQRVDLMGADQFLAVKSKRNIFVTLGDDEMMDMVENAMMADREIAQDAWLAGECTETFWPAKEGYYHQRISDRSVI